jgi:hypothetical protein
MYKTRKIKNNNQTNKQSLIHESLRFNRSNANKNKLFNTRNVLRISS